MATVRPGDASALLVVDMQVGVVADAWDAAGVLERIQGLVRRARQEGVPVIWVQHADDGLPQGSPAWHWAPELVPLADEALIPKGHNSAFEDTALESVLAQLGVSRLVLTGAATNWCIRATAYGALDRGYDLALVADAHTTSPMTLDNGRTIEPAGVIDELNLAMTWLSYPGRRNSAPLAAAVAW
ncbi:isochorismatase family protein [Ideonella sp. 4Y11]|uniref:Isochorismatase family protein n=1 Tax=Ideonella aquatica TaxID=2824119 RepID=A0A940YLL1_9BURK|nr:isochorismatase family protein [Ideonella aquatica]MBQ0961854.1 isochorismatase family protein [Ideonella aquatica]